MNQVLIISVIVLYMLCFSPSTYLLRKYALIRSTSPTTLIQSRILPGMKEPIHRLDQVSQTHCLVFMVDHESQNMNESCCGPQDPRSLLLLMSGGLVLS